jgi:hypothetical protein
LHIVDAPNASRTETIDITQGTFTVALQGWSCLPNGETPDQTITRVVDNLRNSESIGGLPDGDDVSAVRAFFEDSSVRDSAASELDLIISTNDQASPAFEAVAPGPGNANSITFQTCWQTAENEDVNAIVRLLVERVFAELSRAISR